MRLLELIDWLIYLTLQALFKFIQTFKMKQICYWTPKINLLFLIKDGVVTQHHITLIYIGIMKVLEVLLLHFQ